MMDFPTSIAISVGTVTFGLLALGIVRIFRNNRGNPGPNSNRFVSKDEFKAYREGFDNQVKSMEKSLSREIAMTRETFIREIGEVKESLNRMKS